MFGFFLIFNEYKWIFLWFFDNYLILLRIDSSVEFIIYESWIFLGYGLMFFSIQKIRKVGNSEEGRKEETSFLFVILHRSYTK